MIIDPWSSELVSNSKLFEEFGMQKLEQVLLERIKKLSKAGAEELWLLDRGLLFGHRGLDLFASAVEKGEQVAVLSGIKPSNEFHLGSKLTAEELIMFQKAFRAKAFYAIADLEAIADNKLDKKQTEQYAVSNVADLLALGLDEKNAVIYRQSERVEVLKTGFIASTKVTNSMLRAIYGEKEIALYLSALIQIGDILLPQEELFGGKKHVLVPVGADQDPHIRLARDVATKLGLVQPSATYHSFTRALDGQKKMSKRNPESVLSMGESGQSLKKKLGNVFTGGRNTADEQRKLGGEIGKCVFYELCRAHFLKDGKQLEEMKEDCVSGKNLCGECKAKYGKVIVDFFDSHNQKKQKQMEKAKRIVGVD